MELELGKLCEATSWETQNQNQWVRLYPHIGQQEPKSLYNKIALLGIYMGGGCFHYCIMAGGHRCWSGLV